MWLILVSLVCLAGARAQLPSWLQTTATRHARAHLTRVRRPSASRRVDGTVAGRAAPVWAGSWLAERLTRALAAERKRIQNVNPLGARASEIMIGLRRRLTGRSAGADWAACARR